MAIRGIQVGDLSPNKGMPLKKLEIEGSGLTDLGSPRGPGLADRLEDSLDRLELIRGEGVVLDEILAVLELPKRHAAVLEGELALEDVAPLLEDGFEVALHVGQFRQQAGLDDLIDVGAGEGQRREETALDFREVLLFRLAHVAQHGVHVLLGRDDDPRPAAADRP